MDHQRRRGHAAERLAEIAFRHRAKHRARTLGAHVHQHRARPRDDLRIDVGAEQRLEEVLREGRRSAVERTESALEALGDRLGRQRSRPAGVRRGQDERPGQRRRVPSEREGEGRAEREPDDVGTAEPNGVDERGEQRRVVVHPEPRGWIVRPAATGRIPGDERQLVGERELRLPLAVVGETAVEQEGERAVADAAVGDSQPVDADRLARGHVSRSSRSSIVSRRRTRRASPSWTRTAAGRPTPL